MATSQAADMTNPTPVPLGRFEGLTGKCEVTSTPYSQEMETVSRLNTDERWKDPDYQLVQEDLKTTQRIGFVAMLKAMIMMKRVREEKEGEEALSPGALEAYGIKEVDILIKEAVDFCNDSNRSQKVKDKLGEALQIRGDVSRHQPLVVAFNTILVDFLNRDVGSLQRTILEDAALYTINDPLVIESARLPKVTEQGTKCKPGICEVSLERLLNLAQPGGLGDETLTGLAKYMEVLPKDWESDLKGSGSRLGWSDVVHCIEVKASTRGALAAVPPRFFEPYTVSAISLPGRPCLPLIPNDEARPLLARQGVFSRIPGLYPNRELPQDGASTVLSAPVTPPRSGAQKRAAESLLEAQPAKRPRSELALAEAAQASDLNPPLRADIQCAFYGIELLRAAWDKTHSIVTLLSDNNLSIRWYDSQGSILTDTVDIVEQLPLLVAMVVLFQRFKKPMRGVAGVNLEMNLDGERVKLGVPANARIRWELKGRRPVTCVPVPVGAEEASQTKRPRRKRASNKVPPSDEPRPELVKLVGDHFFKWSWRENTRDKEADIIAKAKERAAQYLGDHQSDVTNHLPDVKYAESFDSLSTAHIRKYAGLDATEARVPSLMISKRLSEVEDLDRCVLTVKIWEILRCILLLWRLGIAHRDISLGNLMVNETKEGRSHMVLNDFDLAAVMKPGDTSPAKAGFERTGTKPFMAVEILAVSTGSVKRLCRHDLESIIWVLVWMCLRDENWVTDPHHQVATYKAGYALWAKPQTVPDDIAEKDAVLWKPVMTMALVWMTTWALAIATGDSASLTEGLLLDTIEKVMPCPEEYRSWDWVKFQIP